MNARKLFPLEKAYGDAFCNREMETKKLIGNLKCGKHTFIVASRRYGKSSLCEQAFSLSSLSENQRKIMKYIASFGGANLYSSDVAKAMDIPQGSVRGAIEQLLEKDFIQKQEETFMVVIPLYKKILTEA